MLSNILKIGENATYELGGGELFRSHISIQGTYRGMSEKCATRRVIFKVLGDYMVLIFYFTYIAYKQFFSQLFIGVVIQLDVNVVGSAVNISIASLISLIDGGLS